MHVWVPLHAVPSFGSDAGHPGVVGGGAQCHVGGPVMQMPLEAVEEFAISTQRFSAANGRSEGAAINMITKSGTNNYHGSLFGFFRDQDLK